MALAIDKPCVFAFAVQYDAQISPFGPPPCGSLPPGSLGGFLRAARRLKPPKGNI